MRHASQESESIELAVLLALSGGLMDCYSYLVRDHVFANAQTGNILLFGVNLSQGNWATACHYLGPILAFIVGLALSDLFRLIRRGTEKLHWRQVTVALEAIVLFIVSFLPQSMNLLGNSLTSLACGLQVESFRKIHGNGIATTMCIGNLRSATQNLCEYFRTKNGEFARKSGLYFFTILCFTIGAIFGNLAVNLWAEKAIRVASILLVIAFCMMFVDFEREEREVHQRLEEDELGE